MTVATLPQGLESRAALNQLWASLMLEELFRLGVKHICIAPGSRSTPLTLAAARHGGLTVHTHFDERGLGFLALGLAKASDQPVAVVVTSGTAVANLLPAVAESGLTGEKLVLLTSDRPTELIQCGANQAIRQHGIFSTHVTAFEDIPSPTMSISPAWLLSTVDKAMQQQAVRGGAVHFNCHYPEPLYGCDQDFSDYLQPVARWQSSSLPLTVYPSPMAGCAVPAWQDCVSRKGVLVAGRMAPGELAQVKVLAEVLGWPLLVDPQAGGTSDWFGFDVWMQNAACRAKLAEAEVVLQFGGRLVSKRLGQFIASNPLQHYWLVDPLDVPLDPSFRCTLRLQAGIAQFAAAMASELMQAGQCGEYHGWADSLKAAALRCQQLASDKNGGLNELGLAADMMDWVPQNTTVFLGNSLIVRLLDMFAQMPETATFANRGASGIDGLIATAAGVQRAQLAPMLCVLGDTSLLYDLNSLALLRQQDFPLVVLVTNNDGGAIFDMLPVPEQEKAQFYRMPHGLDFSHAAAMFGLDYVCPATLQDAQQACEQALVNSGTTVIEIQTPAGDSGSRLQALFAEVRDAALL
ncbi:2-succinyl-5-enolpyruvyl-6-hydroxy-3-cyclohexene-1-carboxylate synthase [Photobacterium aquae]|uniref:2-succinyl-5-enolpyruvyl-6-hydroxy-3-cyclohexene-1-carboxylate synthase n=1 Tax=Photobacterium aquae TaxID=1195763 RepID=A0A0J1GWW7_9GAMM|nr:2-succinyl-5-enolpyruvyl-6-hydroxy-3-cyclohexene-1-carboxylic-acid synthase [Photobacterium aquae]KLV03929.1 2-succinyl-5-enolpyruvyl-6-hydroxy-3-cyclohexene-1-carboxylate synthase [Photobacterium aquae]